MTLALLVIAAVAAFFIGNAMNSVLGQQGFGVLGNMVILLAGFLLGLNVISHLPYRALPPEFLLPAAIAFAFAALFGLAVVKRLLRKA